MKWGPTPFSSTAVGHRRPGNFCFGRIARLQGPPEKGPESAPKLPFHCERELALTARNSRSTRGCGRVHAAADAGALGPLLPVLERTAYDIL
jgi:hypothetical protein